MSFKEVFKNGKPVIGMIHTGCSEEFSMLELARKEIEIYMIVGSWFKYGHEAHNEVNEEFVKTFIEALA